MSRSVTRQLRNTGTCVLHPFFLQCIYRIVKELLLSRLSKRKDSWIDENEDFTALLFCVFKSRNVFQRIFDNFATRIHDFQRFSLGKKTAPRGIENDSRSRPERLILIPHDIKNGIENHTSSSVKDFHNRFSQNLLFSTEQFRTIDFVASTKRKHGSFYTDINIFDETSATQRSETELTERGGE